jgi:hypothetical protein
MEITRRDAIKMIGCSLAAAPTLSQTSWGKAAEAPASQGWSGAWDRALLEGVLARWDKDYDPNACLLSGHRGPEYNYQSGLRNTVVHPTRESFEYALLLLESGEATRHERALKVLDRDLPLQETDPESRWCGVWPYYLEEPLARMPAVDLNWADFNGAQLLVILYRHESKLPDELALRIREAVRQAAYAIQRRNVTPYYTNIAVQGSFVTLAAAELLKDDALAEYSLDRIRRVAATVDESGSFAEYNSPTYLHVTLENLTRILTLVRNSEALGIAERMHERLWLHLAAHWHPPTRQLAGPMSRAYSNDIGSPLWLQKATNNQLPFLSLDDIRANPPSESGGVALLAYSCPNKLRSTFLRLGQAHQHREVFISGEKLVDNLTISPRTVPVLPIEGTTYLTPAFALGSANRSDFWVQRRPLLLYWGGPERPPQCVQLRVMKDDYDFASGLFYSVQEAGCVLGAVAFRSNGGDKHPSLDPIRNGSFHLSRLYAQFLFPVWDDAWHLLLDGKAWTDKSEPIPLSGRISIDTGSCMLCFQFRTASFGRSSPTLRFTHEKEQARFDLALFEAQDQETLRWADVNDAHCSFTLVVEERRHRLRDFDRRCAARRFATAQTQEQIHFTWEGPPAPLALTVQRGVHPVAQMDAGYAARAMGKAVPMVRLSDQRILRSPQLARGSKHSAISSQHSGKAD